MFDSFNRLLTNQFCFGDQTSKFFYEFRSFTKDYFKFEISKRRRMCFVNAILSLLASVRTLLSSITVFKDSIHIGSMSPSNTIHFGPSPAMFAWSLIIMENNLQKNDNKNRKSLCYLHYGAWPNAKARSARAENCRVRYLLTRLSIPSLPD